MSEILDGAVELLSVFLPRRERNAGGRNVKLTLSKSLNMPSFSAELSTFGERGGKRRGLEPSHVTRRFRCLSTGPWDREGPDLCISLPRSAIGSDRVAILVVKIHLWIHFERETISLQKICYTCRRRAENKVPYCISKFNFFHFSFESFYIDSCDNSSKKS